MQVVVLPGERATAALWLVKRSAAMCARVGLGVSRCVDLVGHPRCTQHMSRVTWCGLVVGLKEQLLVLCTAWHRWSLGVYPGHLTVGRVGDRA